MNVLIVLFSLILLSLDVVVADNLKIEFTADDSYSIEVANIGVGDTIEWLPKNEGHNVEFLAGPSMEALPENSDLNVSNAIYFDSP